MLERLQKVSGWLRPLLPVAIAMGLLGAAVFLWSATRNLPAEEDAYLIPGILAMIWGAMLFALITGFRRVPPAPDAAQASWVRYRTRLVRALYLLIGWFIIAAGAAALFMTAKLLGLWLG